MVDGPSKELLFAHWAACQVAVEGASSPSLCAEVSTPSAITENLSIEPNSTTPLVMVSARGLRSISTVELPSFLSQWRGSESEQAMVE